MKRYRHLSIILAAIGALQGFAYDFEIKQPDLSDLTNYQHLFLDKSMYFNITSAPGAEQKTCEVTYKSFEVIEGDTVYNVGNTDYTQWLAFPQFIEYNGEKYKVIGIGDHAFQGCADFLSVEFAGDIDYIGKEAFKDCRSLANINYYFALKGISEGAFQNCVKLDKFYLQTPSHISSKAFNGCLGLKNIHISDDIESGKNEYVNSDENAFDIIDGKIDCNLFYYGNPDLYRYYTETAPWMYFKEIVYEHDVTKPLDPIAVCDTISTATVTFDATYVQQSVTLASGINYLITAKAEGANPQFKAGSSGIVTSKNDSHLLTAITVKWGAKSNEGIALYSSETPYKSSNGNITGTPIGTIEFEANSEATFILEEPCRYIGITSTTSKGKACQWESITLSWIEEDLPPAPENSETPEEKDPQKNSPLVINEIMQSNIHAYYFDNEYPDSWVELYNNSEESIQLNGWRLNTSNDFVNAYEFNGDYTVMPHSYIVICCDKEDFGGIHTPFRLESTSKGEVYLFNPQGEIADNVAHKKMPAPNIAYGRLLSTPAEWGYLVTPTPGAENASASSSSLLPAPIFSHTAGLYDAPFSLTVSMPDEEIPAGTRLAVTANGCEPTISDIVDGDEITLEIDKSVTVRARLLSDTALNPVSVTQSYIFHPRSTDMTIVSITTDPDHLFSEDMGIFHGEVDNNPNWDNDWRRPINIEFFEGTEHNATINQYAEIRVMGGYSRRNPQKSINVYSNKRFGKKNFVSENFWPDKPNMPLVKSFTLRNGGNDYAKLHIRDQLAQTLIGRNRRNVDWMAYRPVLYYINGEYKGIYDLRERSNEDFIAANYDGLEDFDMIENWNEAKTEGIDPQESLILPLGKASSLSDFEKLIDVDNFLNMYTLELFACNTDYPHNNIVCWRSRLEENPRWRWIIKDIDRFGVSYIATDFNYFDYIEEQYHKNSTYAKTHNVFYFFITDPEASNLFIDRMAIDMGDYLQSDYIVSVYEELESEIEEEYPFHTNIWSADSSKTFSNFTKDDKWLREWAVKRPEVIYDQMQKRFDLGESYSLTIDRKGLPVSANGIELSRPVFRGKYYSGRDLTLQAEETDGYSVNWIIAELDENDNLIDSYTIEDSKARINPVGKCNILAYPTLKSGIVDTTTGDNDTAVRINGSTIEIDGDIAIVDVYSTDGRLLRHTPASTIAVDSPGIYIVRVTTSQGAISSHRVIIR